ncbi:MAG: alanine racemase [Candidatus Paceibacterota bacterium]|jgi:alanine racemase
MKNFLKKIIRTKRNYDPLIEIHISAETLKNNLAELRKIGEEKGVAPVLKSNAYGHGLVAVAKILENEPKPFFAVDSYFEATALRHEGIKSPILIIGYTRNETIAGNKLNLVAFTITSLEQLRDLSENLRRPAICHLKIDTGMNRQGVRAEELAESVKLIKANPRIELEGLMSHFSSASNPEQSFAKSQIEKWNQAVKFIRKEFPNLKYWHLSATGGHLFTNEIDANVTRAGIGLYGISPSEKLATKINLKPALSADSIITGIKKVKTGEYIGYDLLYKAEKDLTVATIPFGYFEGVDKRLTNKGFVKVSSRDCPIVGRVSMNITTIDVSGIDDLKLNSSVNIVSSNPHDQNSIQNIAKICGASPYEILVHIPEHLKRVVI